MATPVLVFDEINGSGATITQNVGSLVAFASIDEPSNTASLSAANPVMVGHNSFEKWLRARVITPATNTLSNFSIAWATTPVLDTNGNNATIAILGGIYASYPVGGPVATVSPYATTGTPGLVYTLPTPANATDATTVFWVQQLQLSTGVPPGALVFPIDWFALSFVWS